MSEVPAEPIAFLNGERLPFSQAGLSLFDAGFVHGVTATEMLRTFGGDIFREADHWERFSRTCAALGLGDAVDRGEIARQLAEVVRDNRALIEERDDLGLIVFATPGLNRTYIGAAGEQRPTVGVHSFRLDPDLWKTGRERGVHLAVPEVRAIPAESVPPGIKTRSRVHWHLADRSARERFADARAVVLTQAGEIAETAAGNVLALYKDRLFGAPPETILPGVSQKAAVEIAERLGVSFETRGLTPDEFAAADEIWTTSTPSCVLPVTRFEGRPVGDGQIGPMYRRVLAAWEELAGRKIR